MAARPAVPVSTSVTGLWDQLVRGARQHFTWIAGALFLSAAILGICIAPDYGLSWDEPLSHRNGQVSLSFVRTGDPSLWTYSERDYGTLFEMPFVWLQGALGLSSTHTLFVFRHAVTFLVFLAGAFVFFLLCRKRFRSEWLALLGSVFLILSPRIFADAFYNSKDIPFLVFFIISVFTLSRFQERPSFGTVFAHALASAVLIAIRVPGIFVPALTTALFLGNLVFLKEQRARWRKALLQFVSYAILTAGLTIALWPFLWRSPGAHFAEALADMSRFSRQVYLPVLYLGGYPKASQLPWHYIPVWILATTPPLYLFLGALGIAASVAGSQSAGPVAYYRAHWLDLVVFGWFLGPIAGVILLHSVLYDGWRHLYFVYPALIYLGLVGMEAVSAEIQRADGLLRRLLRGGLVLAVLASLTAVAAFMVRNHPYQNLYFNFLTGGIANARRNFDLDYWGLAFRKGLEYIAAHDADPTIPIAIEGGSPETVLILPPEQLRRFVVLPDFQKGSAKYVLTNYRFQDFDSLPFQREVYAVRVDGVKILSVFKVRG